MNRKTETIGLMTFLKGTSNPNDRMPGCANYDHHYGCCLFETGEGRDCSCLVQAGKRCNYFERAVLPTAADIGQLERMTGLYRKKVGPDNDQQCDTPVIRECPDCGGELKRRQRYCSKCSNRRRSQTYRKSRQMKKSNRNS